jgi:predicted ATPase
MMLQRLAFKNFKSWASLDMPCGNITGIFGTNSSGKSSILQFLLLLKQTKDATDRTTALELNGALTELGTIKDALHRQDLDRTLEWSISFLLEKPIVLSDPTDPRAKPIAQGNLLTLSAAVGAEKLAPQSLRLSYEIGGAKFELAPKNGSNSQFDLRADHRAFSFQRTQGRVWQLPRPIKSYAFPDQARTYFQNAGFLADLESAYEKALDRIFYLGPLRQFPQRDYLWARSRPTDVGKQGEKAIDAILAATEASEQRNLKAKGRLKSFQEMIAYWLQAMGLIHDFRVEEIREGSNRWQALVTSREGASEVLLTDVGFGVSQVLPVVTLLQYVDIGSTVILEQPEIHLHPLAQAELADVIIQAAVHRKVQVIFESHSEHLLLRIQRRIAEEALSSENVKLYFADAPNGESQLTPLNLDMFGNVLNWPDRFMGDALGETAIAELKRIERQRKRRGA